MGQNTRHILIVEDEPNVRLVLRAALTSEAYTVSTAEDGETALRRLERGKADLILLDLHMPGLGGMATLQRLRERGIDTPVVIVSAHDSVPNVVQAMRLGAIDFLPKPTTPEALRKVVSDVLARHVTAPEPHRDAPSPQSPTADDLSRAKAALNRRDFEGAAESLRKALDLDPGCAEALYLLGVLHEMSEERHAAYSDYRAALRADPDFEPARLHLMKFYSDKFM
jgi:DNA-binding NtrC family response regulator